MSYAADLEAAQEREKRLEIAESDLDNARYELRQACETKLSLMVNNVLRRVQREHDAEKENIKQLVYKAAGEYAEELATKNREYERSV